jgi:hypothetical protein
MKHVVLLGDSIFDNKAYVGAGPDVAAQLRETLPAGWRVTLCAVDGAVAGDVRRQLETVPEDATHLIVSAGGNDALQHEHVLREWALSVAGVLGKLAEIRSGFRKDYAAMLGPGAWAAQRGLHHLRAALRGPGAQGDRRGGACRVQRHDPA